jgi:transposase
VAQQAAAAAALTEFAEAVVDDGEQQNAHQAAMPVIIVDLGGKGRVSISASAPAALVSAALKACDDPSWRAGVDCDGPHRYAARHAELAAMVQQSFSRDPFAGDLWVFRGRSGALVKIIWHDGLGMSLYSKRLERGKFIWPAAKDGVVSLTSSQLACLLDGVDWRNPQYSWRPQSAG